MDLGTKQYQSYAYVDAIKTYERLAEKGYKSEELYKKLADSYYFNSDFEKAAKWYDELFKTTSTPEAIYYYRYAQSLKSKGQNDKADKVMKDFYVVNNKDSRGELYKENSNYRDQIKANSGRYTIEDAGINSPYSDYGSFVYKNKIYFASARDTGNFAKRIHKWNDAYFSNIYEAEIDPENNLTSAANKIKPKINTRFHESSPVFTKDGKTVYFCRNNFLNGKKGKNSNQIILTKIYRASKENDKWTNIMELPFNSDQFSTAHPCLSPDEKTLYFSSDSPGTFGQSDIYKVQINSNGSFGTPQNLGKEINTEGKETFPFVTSDNELYFASDGHPGLGGLDVFVGQIQNDGLISNIQNIGNDVNSPQDDFAYIIDPVSRRGFFSSNKNGGHGSDDIYKFKENRRLNCTKELKGVITDTENNTFLPGTKVTLYENQNIKNSTITGANGEYSFAVECDKSYNVRVEKPEYATQEINVKTDGTSSNIIPPIALEKSVCRVAVGDNLGKCFKIKLIYFDLDKSNISTESALDLEKILDVLKENPKMKLEIRAHTDSRGSNEYNENLSNQRAQSTIQWLIQNGITKARLSGRGYGESQLINSCSDGVECSEEEHRANRRSEFIITGL